MAAPGPAVPTQADLRGKGRHIIRSSGKSHPHPGFRKTVQQIDDDLIAAGVGDGPVVPGEIKFQFQVHPALRHPSESGPRGFGPMALDHLPGHIGHRGKKGGRSTMINGQRKAETDVVASGGVQYLLVQKHLVGDNSLLAAKSADTGGL